MGFYERRVLPPVLDFAMRQPPISGQRAKVVPKAEGDVLEIGIGSGLNLAHYDQSKVSQLWGLDPSLELRRRALRRSRRVGLRVDFIGLSGEEIPLDDASVDSVVTTFTLCTIPDAATALREMRRVLRPRGRLLFAEHGRAPDDGVVRWQERLSPYWRRVAGGCTLDRRIDQLIRDAGFTLREMETSYLPGPRPWTYNYWGIATREDEGGLEES